jgi:hypothetical protein
VQETPSRHKQSTRVLATVVAVAMVFAAAAGGIAFLLDLLT